MAVRTRKSPLPVSVEPVAEPAAAAPTRRRVPGTRATTTRRPATSSRTLRPIVPPDEPALPEASVPPPPVVQAPGRQVTSTPDGAPPLAELLPEALTPALATAPAETQAVPVAAEGVALAVPVAALAVPPAAELPTPAIPAAGVPVVPAAEVPAPGVPAATLGVAATAEISAAAGLAATLAVMPGMPGTSELAPAAASGEAVAFAGAPDGLMPAGSSEKLALAAAAGLPPMVEQLQADVRTLQGLVTHSTEQTAQELSRTTMQMVRMVTGVAHHLDKLVEQVHQLSRVAQTLAQALTRVEGTVATLHAHTQDQLTLSARGQPELQEVLSPVLTELVALRTQGARNTSLDQLEQFRMTVELKQLRQAVEKYGPSPDLMNGLPRASRAGRTKRGT